MPWEESHFKRSDCEIARKVLAEGRSIVAVAAELGISRKTIYNWKDAHPEFAEAIESGVAKSQAYWESIGRDGITGDNPDFSATPWIFTMKSRFREDYAEKKDDKSASDSLIEKLVDKLIE